MGNYTVGQNENRISTILAFVFLLNPHTSPPQKSSATEFEQMRIHLRKDENPFSIGPANRRPPEETNAHNLFLQNIMQSHNGSGNCLIGRATKLKMQNSKRIHNFFFLIRFPRMYIPGHISKKAHVLQNKQFCFL